MNLSLNSAAHHTSGACSGDKPATAGSAEKSSTFLSHSQHFPSIWYPNARLERAVPLPGQAHTHLIKTDLQVQTSRAGNADPSRPFPGCSSTGCSPDVPGSPNVPAGAADSVDSPLRAHPRAAGLSLLGSPHSPSSSCPGSPGLCTAAPSQENTAHTPHIVTENKLSGNFIGTHL